MKTNIIYLAGFMGAGKSTVGPILANTIGWDFYDLDKLIEKKENRKIRDIFEQSGEAYFRNVESKTLKDLSECSNAIIALGGGAIINKDNFNLMKRTGKIVYLKASPEHIYERLKHKRDRPILLNASGEGVTKQELMQKINKLFDERKRYYENADITVETDNIPVGRTVDDLAHLILKS